MFFILLWLLVFIIIMMLDVPMKCMYALVVNSGAPLEGVVLLRCLTNNLYHDRKEEEYAQYASGFAVG